MKFLAVRIRFFSIYQEQEDVDFHSEQGDSGDEVDSDFDISETDEMVSDQDEESILKQVKNLKSNIVL